MKTCSGVNPTADHAYPYLQPQDYNYESTESVVDACFSGQIKMYTQDSSAALGVGAINAHSC
jgi:hypothetical protein